MRPLAGDASSRRYFRLEDGNRATAILVRYPAEPATFARDLEVLAWLRARGLRVPRVLSVDHDALELVIEDLGSHGAAEVLAAAPRGRRRQLAERLLEPLVTLSALAPSELPSWSPPLGRTRLRWELAGFELWFVRDRLDIAPSQALDRFLDDLAAKVADHPVCVCHRDYHVDNLFLLPGGGVGVIDVQDILVGPDTYDLASLLGERALPEFVAPTDRDRLARAWATRTEALAGWERRLEEAQLQRGLKVLGTFARLERSGRTGYERHIGPLLPRLGALAQRLGAPPSLHQTLLHSSGSGGTDDR